ncbi:unnamed protein product [Allacma fusca]|uniref:Uncharacterized protein n=1 Tax=Allacma fusca TaxID=39272 RepID=A0A8J2JAH0_9HEXA|nr:unnamed protein product [Allacma fusca]
MLKERDENFIEKALWVHSLFSPQIRTPPRVRRRIFLLLLYIIEILGRRSCIIKLERVSLIGRRAGNRPHISKRDPSGPILNHACIIG